MKLENLQIPENSIDGVFSWGVIQYINPKNEYKKYQSEFLRILNKEGKICHFQIPARFYCLYSHPVFNSQRNKFLIKNTAKCFRDLFTRKHNEYSFKYTKRNLLKFNKEFSNILIIQDDFFMGRISVIYAK